MKYVNFRLKLGSGILAVFILVSIIVPLLSTEDPTTWGTYMKNLKPSNEHIFGTTGLGQDTFILLATSIRNSFIIGITVAGIATIIGVFLGLLAGFKGGILDKIVILFSDSFIVIPSLPILILVSSLIKGTAPLLFIIIILIVFSWSPPARQARAMALSIRERDFINVARFSGEGTFEIVFKEILPYIYGWSMANFVNGILAAIAAESTLAVIGMSSNDSATLGTMIYWANQHQAMLGERWFWIGSPVLSTAFIFISLFLVMTGYQQYSSKRRGINA